MYHTYFGLTEPPFSIAVDPRYLYMSDRHRDALAHLVYGVGTGGGFILLSGEVGTGKTTILRCLLEQLPDDTDLALVLNPTLDARQLLATVCGELGIDADASDLKCLTDRLHRFLLDNHQRGRNTVLLIDEAQHLDATVLEQIRLLTNLETNTKKLLQIVLVGQPELKDKLAQPELRQLSQRITARFELQPLDAPETAAYIDHRLQVGGLTRGQRLFSSRISTRIHRASGGIPRVINIICDRALLGCYGKNKEKVDRQTLRQAVAEVKGVEQKASSTRDPAELGYSLALSALALTTLIALLWWNWQLSTAPSQLVPTVVEQSEPIPVEVPAMVQLVEEAVEAEDALESEEVVEGEEVIEIEESVQIEAAVEVEAKVVPEETVVLEETVEPEILLDDWWFVQQSAAINTLLISLGYLDVSVEEPCAELAEFGLRCERLQVDGWSDLRSYQAPALLELVDAGEARWVLVRSLVDDHAVVLGPEGETRLWSQDELGANWQGRVLVPWLAPPGYRNPLREGSFGRAVSWLAQGFAQLDGQQQALADHFYNELLAQRVRLFQREQKLYVDGVAGLRTMLRMQQLLASESAPQADVAVLGEGA
jgi:general secretion pathway protein A